MAFVPGVPLALPSARTPHTRPCVCMKKRSGGAKKSPKARKGFATTRPQQAGAGTDLAKTQDASASAPSASVASNGVALDSGTRESTSGAEGDATPHRMSVSEVQKLQDPTKSVTSTFEVAAREEADEDAANLAKLRLDWKLTHDELIEKFEDARKVQSLEPRVRANRHLVTEALLYRFTSAILAAEGEERMEEATNMRELRRQLIALSWDIDMPFKRSILAAEERLMRALQSGDVGKETRRKAGDTTREVDAYWVVAFAAVAAWEERGKQNQELRNVDMQAALAVVAMVYRDYERVRELQSACLRIVGEVLNLADQAKQAELLEQLDEDDVMRLAIFVEQIRLLPVNAYDALRRRMKTILEFVLAKRYGITPTPVRTVRFGMLDIERTSKITRLQVGLTKPKAEKGAFRFRLPWES